jgi:hypothetical protein
MNRFGLGWLRRVVQQLVDKKKAGINPAFFLSLKKQRASDYSA